MRRWSEQRNYRILLGLISQSLMMSWRMLQEFVLKPLRYRDLPIICSQLKIKRVKSSTKEQMIQKLAASHKIKAKYEKISDTSDPALPWKAPHCPYRLLKILSSNAFAKGFAQLENVTDHTAFDAGKQPTIRYFGKLSKKPLKDKTNHMTVDILLMMRF